MKFEFGHFDSGLRTVFLQELETSQIPVTYDMLKPLQGKIREKINKKWFISIFHTDLKAWEFAQGGDNGTIL